MNKDRVFAEKLNTITPFRFNENVARVFDDMLVRSVPLYGEVLKQQARIARKFYQKDTRIFDLGCSHGNLGVLLLDLFGATAFKMTGVDSSWPMIQRFKNRLCAHDSKGCIDLACTCIEDIIISNASVVVINLTLQFLDPVKRDHLIESAFNGLCKGGILLLTEKTVHPAPQMNALEQEYYYQFKKENGYTDLEISQKRDALEQVLIPETLAEHEARIHNAGFSSFNVWLKWFNFTSMIAVK
ncbi:carboxy-S-adenosyl-L-methionine synthase CmoA [uncultured Desulfobacter sp.]|uniref:carboxy-S-adenosyl-L-methionine synthase CmoA n=1 Tax=uncultured Desulfobacter sp. TaxID=240139 RepID=UPI002AAA870C|nr:carboxy-S-adenosyl-L-methionine synthase CmoA [uncultured Desulfobacter sp.]